MNYDELIWHFRTKAAVREVVRISIPEGWSIDQIIDRFVIENGIGTREGFVKVLEETDFSEMGYRFLEPLYQNKANLSPDRKYLLEGYLFPDTYDFYLDEREINIIIRFLDNFNVKFASEFYIKAALLGMTLDEVLTLASIIEREGRYRDDLAKISAVFHNRLLNPAVFPNLESDATIMYDFGYVKQDLTRADLQIDSPYNTYTRPGLPPSAICNPGYESINAALWPLVDDPEWTGTQYFFFVTDMRGRAHFSRTQRDHEIKVNEIRIEREQAAANAGN